MVGDQLAFVDNGKGRIGCRCFLCVLMGSNLDYFGLKIDLGKNKEAIQKEAIISTDDSSISVLIIPTNEELVIAQDTAKIVKDSPQQKA